VIAERHELLERFGHGGMGKVWRGCDAVLDRPVAVKLIGPQVDNQRHKTDDICKIDCFPLLSG
jgi:serine/threonine protein kinase